MKRVFNLIAFLVCFISFSQNAEALKSDTEKMYEASYILDYETIIKLTYPKVFEYVSREDMIEVMESAFENDDFRVRFVHPKMQFEYGDFVTVNNATFCVIRYKNAMRMTFEKKISDEMSKTIIGGLLQNQDYSLVSFEKERNGFLIEGNSVLIAVSDDLTNKEWKYINYSKSQNELIELLLSEPILTQLGL